MRIAKDRVVTLRQRVSVPDGSVVDQGEAPIGYVHGGYHDIFDKIEQALEGRAVGEVVTVRLEPKDAFDEYDPDRVVVAGLDQFHQPPRQGDMVERDQGDGSQIYRVTEVRDDAVVLDGNHPFAGLTLDFQAEILDVRAATQEEVARVRKTVSASISRLRAFKMAAIFLVAAPVMLLLAVGGLVEWLESGVLLDLGLLFCLAVLIGLLWSGGRYVRDLIRGGEVLRVDVNGLYWRDFGAPVAWGDIATVRFERSGQEVWYAVTLADRRSFKVDASALTIDTGQISGLFTTYLPKAKLEGL